MIVCNCAFFYIYIYMYDKHRNALLAINYFINFIKKVAIQNKVE